MLFATVVKLALWLYCRTSGNKIVCAYAEDHYFDVVTNVVALVAAVLADKYYWWIDPSGAIILALYTIINWSKTVMENAVSLVGQSAPPEFLQMLTYAVMRYPQVKCVDTVRAYTFGVLYFVEVDIKLPEELPLKEAHAIGESLQINLRSSQKLSEHLFILTLNATTNQNTMYSSSFQTVSPDSMISLNIQKVESELLIVKHEAELQHMSSTTSDLKIQQEKELALTASKFAEYYKTIASIGQQLKSLAALEDILMDSDSPSQLIDEAIH